jgi:lipoteichoic acid synthase
MLAVPATAGRWAVATFAGALVALVAVKIVRLPTARSEGIFDAQLAQVALAGAWGAVCSAAITQALLLVVVGGWLLGRLWPQMNAWRRAAFVLGGVWLLAVAAAGINSEPRPVFPFFIQNLLQEGSQFGALFWRDVCTALILGALAGILRLRDAPWRRWLQYCIVAVLLVVLSIDAAYFVAARADLTRADVSYFLQQPLEVLALSGDAWSADLVLPMVLPWLAIPCGALVGFALAIRVRQRAARASASDDDVRLGPILWPTLLLVIAAPAAPSSQRELRFVDNVLMRGVDEMGRLPVRWLISGPDSRQSAGTAKILPGPSSLAPRASAPRSNVVLILLESTRADAVSSGGVPSGATPFLQQLAAQSLQVDQMYAVVPRTSAAWMATIAGVYPTSVASLRNWAKRFPSARVHSSLAALLGLQGYQTGFFVPTRLDFENDDRVIQSLGFQTVVSGHELAARKAERLNSFGYADEAILPDIATWLDKQVAGRTPFFMSVMTYSGHYPYDVPKSWRNRSEKGVGSMPGRYLRAISYADHQVEQIFAMLRARSLLDESLVIVLGDHGEAFNEHDLVWHSSVPYQEALRIPAFVRLPGPKRRVGHIGGPRQQIDIAPTVADVLGLQPAGGTWAGSSLLAGVAADRPILFGTHFDDLHLGLLRGARKYIYHFDRQPTDVFDLSSDPSETRSLAGEVSSADLSQAQSQMRDWYGSVREAYSRNQL